MIVFHSSKNVAGFKAGGNSWPQVRRSLEELVCSKLFSGSRKPFWGLFSGEELSHFFVQNGVIEMQLSKDDAFCLSIATFHLAKANVRKSKLS